MTREELQQRLSLILPAVYEAADKLKALRDSPEWDESYKVERDARITVEALDEMQALAEDLAAACNFSSPPPLELDLPEGSVDGLVLGGLALMSSFGSKVAGSALAGAAFELTRARLEQRSATPSPHVEPERCRFIDGAGAQCARDEGHDGPHQRSKDPPPT
jgi:hypothetical protein